ncbi:MAG: hypothetical protein JXB26_04120 [Candidatus Aminicenantes bacterium]|nr:hypothetical protein [Candidatus Aminicenantes bacterium]
MEKNSRDTQGKKRQGSPLKFVYIIAGCMFLYFTRGDMPFGLAVWLSFVFLLRFFRTSRPILGYVFAVPPAAISIFWASKGMMLLPANARLFYSLFISIVFFLPFLLDRLIVQKIPKWGSFLLFPSLMVSFYYLVSFSYNGTWGNPAYALSGNIILLQLTSLTGIWGLVFLPCLFASVFNALWENRFSVNEARLPVFTFLMLFFLVFLYGFVRLRYFSYAEDSMRAAIVTPDKNQRDILRRTLFYLVSAQKVKEEQIDKLRLSLAAAFQNLLKESEKQVSAGAQIVAWSEAAVILFECDKEELFSKACELAQKNRVHLGLTAIIVRKGNILEPRAEHPGFRNTFIFINSEGKKVFEHHKSKLLPRLETNIYNPGNGTFTAYETDKGMISAAICYETLFPDVIRRAAKPDTRILIIPSSDWKEIKNTHARIAVTRAVENGFSLLRPTSDGISMAADPFGRIFGRIDYSTKNRASLTMELPVKKVDTLYAVLGDWLAWLCLLVSAALVASSLF